jgi:hypothetical protein
VIAANDRICANGCRTSDAMPSTVAIAPGPNISGIASGTKATSPARASRGISDGRGGGGRWQEQRETDPHQDDAADDPNHAERHLKDLQQQRAKDQEKEQQQCGVGAGPPGNQPMRMLILALQPPDGGRLSPSFCGNCIVNPPGRRQDDAAGPSPRPTKRAYVLSRIHRGWHMMIHRTLARVFGDIVAGLLVAIVPGIVRPAQKSNILFIMGDDIGWMQPGIYHEGLAAGETPNIEGSTYRLVLRSIELQDGLQAFLETR